MTGALGQPVFYMEVVGAKGNVGFHVFTVKVFKVSKVASVAVSTEGQRQKRKRHN